MKNKANINRTEGYKYLSILLIFLIFQSTNAQEQWRIFTTQNSQLPTNIVGPIVIDTNNVKWIGTVLGMVKIDGNNWTIYDTSNTPLGDSRIAPEAFDSHNNLWVIVYGKGISKFNGNVWTIYDTVNSGIVSNSITNIKINVNNTKWIGTNKGLVKYNDTSWVTYNTINSGIPDNFVKSLAVDDGVLWIGHYTFSPNFGLTRYDGANWTVYNVLNSGLPSDMIEEVAIDFLNNKWIATSFGGLAKFNYSLNQWTIYNSTNSGLPENNLYSVLTNGHTKWIGTQGSGLAYYNDTNWTIFTASNSPLPSNAVFNLIFDRDQNLWICTAGGLAIYNATGIVGVYSNLKNFPLDFVLYQNYPNPFNPSTTIKYELPNDGMITFKIYDIHGQEIYSINEFSKAGIHEIKFDGSNFASGVYFYRFESGSFIETKKMVLIK